MLALYTENMDENNFAHQPQEVQPTSTGWPELTVALSIVLYGVHRLYAMSMPEQDNTITWFLCVVALVSSIYLISSRKYISSDIKTPIAPSQLKATSITLIALSILLAGLLLWAFLSLLLLPIIFISALGGSPINLDLIQDIPFVICVALLIVAVIVKNRPSPHQP